MQYCKYYCNAAVESILTPENDLSYIGIGIALKDYDIQIKSGSNMATTVIFSKWNESRGE